MRTQTRVEAAVDSAVVENVSPLTPVTPNHLVYLPNLTDSAVLMLQRIAPVNPLQTLATSMHVTTMQPRPLLENVS